MSVRKGNAAQALSKLITMAERHPADATNLIAKLRSKQRRARRIGITGPPGAGKSVLINTVIGHFRGLKKKVGVLAIDPSSPLSGGALLADRIRMQGHAKDPAVFIRSMANKQKAGGIAPALENALHALEIYHHDVILVETIGAGQSDTALRPLCDTILVLAPPDSVDIMQAMKSGILEIADILVVSKADLPRTEHAVQTLNQMVSLREASPRRGRAKRWQTPVVAVSALKDVGLNRLWKEIERHGRFVYARKV
jgi:LAO/AO transport system kinase